MQKDGHFNNSHVQQEWNEIVIQRNTKLLKINIKMTVENIFVR